MKYLKCSKCQNESNIIHFGYFKNSKCIICYEKEKYFKVETNY